MPKVGDVVRVGDVGVVVDVSCGKNWTSCRVRFFHQAQETPWPVARREIEHVEGR